MKNSITKKTENKNRRQVRIRAKVSGTALRPRFSVFRSNNALYVQLIDDETGKTVLSGKTAAGQKPVEAAFALGKEIADKAKAQKIETVVFDRGGNKYHGRVKAVAEGAREGGLIF